MDAGRCRRDNGGAGVRRARHYCEEAIMSETTKFLLGEQDIPTRWYNIVADMPNKPMPPIHPATHQPIGPEALAPLFPTALIEQERLLTLVAAFL